MEAVAAGVLRDIPYIHSNNIINNNSINSSGTIPIRIQYDSFITRATLSGTTCQHQTSSFPSADLSHVVDVDVVSQERRQEYWYTVSMIGLCLTLKRILFANRVSQHHVSLSLYLSLYSFRQPGSTLLLDHVENKSPFTAVGVSNVTGQLFNPISSLLVPGMYVLTATPFSGMNQEGYVGKDVSINIDVWARCFVNNFTLVDATTGIDVAAYDLLYFSYVTPPTIDLFKFPNVPTFSVRANTVGTVASVAFQLNQTNLPEEFPAEDILLLSQVDNQAPFLLGPAPQLSVPGNYLIAATPYSKPNKRGYKGSLAYFSLAVFP